MRYEKMKSDENQVKMTVYGDYCHFSLAIEMAFKDNIKARRMDHWCSGPTCLPVTEEITSSNLVWSAMRPGSSVGRAKD